MTILSLSLSSTFPGTWTKRATSYATVATLSPADDYGNPTGAPSSTITSDVSASGIDLGGSVDIDTVYQVLLTDLAFTRSHLHHDAGLVTVASYVNGYSYDTGDGPASRQTITAAGPWNGIKNVAVSEVSTQGLTITILSIRPSIQETPRRTASSSPMRSAAV